MFIRGTHTTAVSVGEIIKDLLEARGWTQKNWPNGWAFLKSIFRNLWMAKLNCRMMLP